MSGGTREILVFQVGPSVFAAQVHDALRIGSVRDVPAEELLVDTVLGAPFDRARGIAIPAGDAGQERTLVVDQVLGVRTVAAEDLRPLPALAAACLSSAAITGFADLDGIPTLLVDLRILVRERSGAAPHTQAA